MRRSVRSTRWPCGVPYDLGIGDSSFGLVGLDRRKREVEDRSPGLVRSRPEPAAMGDHDRTADGKTHPHSLGLGGEEGVEDPIQRSGLKAGARVADFDEDLLPAFAAAGDRQLARRGTWLPERGR